jgi:DNA repair REX1-B
MGPPTSAPDPTPTVPSSLAPPRPLPATVLGLCDEVLEVQRERALAYAAFNDGFKFYLENGAEGPYRSLIVGLTHQFQNLSQRALAVESALRTGGAGSGEEDSLAVNRPDIADVIRAIQNAERKKLEVTLAMHSMKAAVHHERFSWQHGDGGIGGEHTCNHHHHGHSHDENGACAEHAVLREEPTEGDINGALKESYNEMEACIVAINDGIAELQEFKLDLE